MTIKSGAFSHKEATLQSFHRDSELAAEYLNSVPLDINQEDMFWAFKQVVQVFANDEDLDSTIENLKILYQVTEN